MVSSINIEIISKLNFKRTWKFQSHSIYHLNFYISTKNLFRQYGFKVRLAKSLWEICSPSHHLRTRKFNARTSRLQMFFKIDSPKNAANFTVKHYLRWGLFLIKFQSLWPDTVLKSDFDTGIFLWNLQKF